jgi:hypothetical protein
VADQPTLAAPPNPYGAVQRVVAIAATVGIAAAIVALIDGIVLMVKRKVTECPDGHFFPEGTKNFDCYAHPRLAEGLAISALAVTLAALLLIAALASLAALKPRGETSAADPVRPV